MPTVICSYCNYVGQSKGKYANEKYRSYELEIQDVKKHEKTCSERIALKEE